LSVIEKLLQCLVALILLHTTLDHDPRFQNLGEHLGQKGLSNLGFGVHDAVGRNVDVVFEQT
jgi:hypothetical protein